MKKLKIQHYRRNCIGCNACVQLAPQTWEMSEKDGRAILKGGISKGGIVTADLSPLDLSSNQQAAESCPTRIIKIITS